MGRGGLSGYYAEEATMAGPFDFVGENGAGGLGDMMDKSIAEPKMPFASPAGMPDDAQRSMPEVTHDWSGAYDDASEHADDDWSGLLISTADDVVASRALEDADNIGFGRSASAPDLLGAAAPASWKGSSQSQQDNEEHLPAQYVRPARAKPSMERSASTPSLVGLESHSPYAEPSPLLLRSSDEATSDTASPRPAAKLTKRRVSRTAEERKQRRLETNRAAAKRAYYRRQGKMNATKDDNDRLRKLTELQAERIRVYEAMLRKVGIDPASYVQKHAPGHAARSSKLQLSVASAAATEEHEDQPPAAADGHSHDDDDDDASFSSPHKQSAAAAEDDYADSKGDVTSDDEEADTLPTKATRTHSGRAVRRPRPADQIPAEHDDRKPASRRPRAEPMAAGASPATRKRRGAR